jgi:tight adherence protein C
VSAVALVAGGAVAVGGLGAVGLGLRAAAADRRQSDALAYLEELDSRGDARDADLFAEDLARPFVDRVVRPLVGRVVGAVGSIAPRDHRARVRTQIARAGLEGRRRPEEVIALQGVGGVAGLVLGLGLLATARLGPVLAVVTLLLLVGVGTFGPLVWLSRQVEQRAARLRSELPETLDLLAITVEAGLGLEGAMAVVVERSQGPLADEISRTLQEMGLGLSRHDALVHLRQRSQVSELSSFVQALIQADALGMPLGRVLKAQAAEMRLRRRQWARERAAKLPVKILFPLIACIFPAVLVVVLGPAVGEIGKAF